MRSLFATLAFSILFSTVSLAGTLGDASRRAPANSYSYVEADIPDGFVETDPKEIFYGCTVTINGKQYIAADFGHQVSGKTILGKFNGEPAKGNIEIVWSPSNGSF
ncbi:MAG: hypothetical protein VZR00_09655 [Lachnospiraceae bacterium]|nr:hypothetical protein [Oribacterium sp.]MEE3462128.1 hypothetical protein [Lachnospiraceae bacterium]